MLNVPGHRGQHRAPAHHVKGPRRCAIHRETHMETGIDQLLDVLRFEHRGIGCQNTVQAISLYVLDGLIEFGVQRRFAGAAR